ncbi:hypothetical protein Agub_g9887, partial [Astrephomene gubernaculifera]
MQLIRMGRFDDASTYAEYYGYGTEKAPQRGGGAWKKLRKLFSKFTAAPETSSTEEPPMDRHASSNFRLYWRSRPADVLRVDQGPLTASVTALRMDQCLAALSAAGYPHRDANAAAEPSPAPARPRQQIPHQPSVMFGEINEEQSYQQQQPTEREDQERRALRMQQLQELKQQAPTGPEHKVQRLDYQPEPKPPLQPRPQFSRQSLLNQPLQLQQAQGTAPSICSGSSRNSSRALHQQQHSLLVRSSEPGGHQQQQQLQRQQQQHQPEEPQHMQQELLPEAPQQEMFAQQPSYDYYNHLEQELLLRQQQQQAGQPEPEQAQEQQPSSYHYQQPNHYQQHDQQQQLQLFQEQQQQQQQPGYPHQYDQQQLDVTNICTLYGWPAADMATANTNTRHRHHPQLPRTPPLPTMLRTLHQATDPIVCHQPPAATPLPQPEPRPPPHPHPPPRPQPHPPDAEGTAGMDRALWQGPMLLMQAAQMLSELDPEGDGMSQRVESERQTEAGGEEGEAAAQARLAVEAWRAFTPAASSTTEAGTEEAQRVYPRPPSSSTLPPPSYMRCFAPRPPPPAAAAVGTPAPLSSRLPPRPTHSHRQLISLSPQTPAPAERPPPSSSGSLPNSAAGVPGGTASDPGPSTGEQLMVRQDSYLRRRTAQTCGGYGGYGSSSSTYPPAGGGAAATSRRALLLAAATDGAAGLRTTVRQLRNSGYGKEVIDGVDGGGAVAMRGSFLTGGGAEGSGGGGGVAIRPQRHTVDGDVTYQRTAFTDGGNKNNNNNNSRQASGNYRFEGAAAQDRSSPQPHYPGAPSVSPVRACGSTRGSSGVSVVSSGLANRVRYDMEARAAAEHAAAAATAVRSGGPLAARPSDSSIQPCWRDLMAEAAAVMDDANAPAVAASSGGGGGGADDTAGAGVG